MNRQTENRPEPERERNEGKMKPCLNLSAALAAALLLCGCATEAPKEQSGAQAVGKEYVQDMMGCMHYITNHCVRLDGFDFERAYKPPAPDSYKYLYSLKGKPLWRLSMEEQWRVSQHLERVATSEWAPFYITDFHPFMDSGAWPFLVEKKMDSKTGIGVFRIKFFFPLDGGLTGAEADEIRTGWPIGKMFVSSIKNMEVKDRVYGDAFVFTVDGQPCPILGRETAIDFAKSEVIREYYTYTVDGLRWSGFRLVRIEDDKGNIVRNDYRSASHAIGEIGRANMVDDFADLRSFILSQLAGDKDENYYNRLTTLEWMYGRSLRSDQIKQLLDQKDINSRIKELARSSDKWMREAAQMVLKTYGH